MFSLESPCFYTHSVRIWQYEEARYILRDIREKGGCNTIGKREYKAHTGTFFNGDLAELV